MGTVRFRHLQRSKLLELSEEVIAVACNKDKNPKHDASPGYVWILPKRSLAYEDLGEKFWNSVQGAVKVMESEADFLPFDFHPRGWQPQEATSFSMQETSYNRFIKCVEQMRDHDAAPSQDAPRAGQQGLL